MVRKTAGKSAGRHAAGGASRTARKAPSSAARTARRPSAKGSSARRASATRRRRVNRRRGTGFSRLFQNRRMPVVACAAVLLLALIAGGAWKLGARRDEVSAPVQTPEATQEVWQGIGNDAEPAEASPEETELVAAPEPTPEPTAWAPREMGEIFEDADPGSKAYGYQQRIVANGELLKVESAYTRENPIAMGSNEDYAQVEGILTFRGNNYRDTAAYGLVPNNASGLEIVWSKKTGYIDEWTGVGWTGQASIVRWPEETRQLMNINAEKKAKDGLCEVIYGTLDGKIYFLDLDDGKETREPIQIPSSIKGSVSVDPRGLPLLYCGQGIPEVKGKEVKIGTHIFSLIDQERLYFLNGRDKFCLRKWYAFDCSPLIDAASDTMIQLGENGIVYTIQLNTEFDADTGALSIDPVVDRVVYKSKVSTRPGMENSPAIYDHYAYYTDNSGLLVCMDLNTLEPVWMGDVGDDSDACLVLEEDENGVWLYNVCELDLNGLAGNVYCRKYNALTGEQMWKIGVPCLRRSSDVEAGGFATPAVGKGSLSELVYFNISRVESGGGRLGAVNKETGEVVWQISTGASSWSTPTCVYDEEGRGYVLFCNSSGILRLCDGLTGAEIAGIELGDNIEGSPAIFGDMLVIGTRGQRIFGVRITA